MIYYNQNNYPKNPYPSSSNPKATIKTGGCGPTSAAMIVSNMAGKTIDPIAMAAYSISKSARNSGGTDMNILAKAICADYGLTYQTTNDENALLSHLKSSKMAIANVGGDRSGYKGVFSDGGHYIVVAGLTSGGKVIVLDPGCYSNKFTINGRTGKVTVSGNECICDISILAADTSNRSPAYWLFTKNVSASSPDTSISIVAGSTKITGQIINGSSCGPIGLILAAKGIKYTWYAAKRAVVINGANTSALPAATTGVTIAVGAQAIVGQMVNATAWAPIAPILKALGIPYSWDASSRTLKF